MTIEHDPWIHPNLIGKPVESAPRYESKLDWSPLEVRHEEVESAPTYESKLLLRANRSLIFGCLGPALQLLPFLIGDWLAPLLPGMIGLEIIFCTLLTIVIGAVYGIVSAKRVKKETSYKSLAYNRAVMGQVLNGLSLMAAMFFLLIGVLLLLVAVSIASWK